MAIPFAQERVKNMKTEAKHRTPEPLDRASLEHFPREPEAHPTSWTFPAYLDNPNCRWLQALKRMYERGISFPASLSPEAGLMLHGLVRNIHPRVVVEVGTFVSVSTHWICAALEENDCGEIHCFDDFGPIAKGPWRDEEMTEDRLEWVKARLGEAGFVDRCTFYRGNSSPNIIKARETLASKGGVDFAFIDGDHTVPGVVADFEAVEPVLNTGGFVMFHDTFPELCGNHLGPRHVLDHLNEIGRGRYELCELYLSPLNYGMGLARRIA